MKIYEAWFGRMGYSRELGDGLRWNVLFQYQDRLPLENTTNYKWRTLRERVFTPNYPTEILNENFSRHQAFVFSTGLTWQPGSRYIEFPDRKVSMGSRYPVFFGSDVKYSKWRLGISDDFSMKLAGSFNYRISAGGFINRDSVSIQDYTHYNGNKYVLAETYLNSFQLAAYYKYSNKERFYSEVHLEYHLNGFLTNKIPGFRKLNWFLVTGTNAFYINKNNNYIEAFVGLENILKIIRIDFVQSWPFGNHPSTGFRIGFRGLLGN
jgi:hypothetical protein